MNIIRLYRTIKYLTPTQILFQIKNRVIRRRYCSQIAPLHRKCELLQYPIPRYATLFNENFTFLNIQQNFDGWNDVSQGNLYAYNINYFDYINSTVLSKEDACKWIDKFILEIGTVTLGMDPYPIALRAINWIKFFSKYPDCITEDRDRALWSQLCLLEKKLEFHLLGNHLLEDAFSLFISSIYFNDETMYHRYSKLLKSELQEQILGDGAHYEQSPMYHCILLDRLLDCYNFSFSNPTFDKQDSMNDCLRHYASLMLGHLEAIIYSTGDIPLLNDSAYGVAPTSSELFDYAKRLDIKWTHQPLKECGYRYWTRGGREVIIDVGNITASYQPGHSHADTLTYELRIDGVPFVVDTGISTYNKNARRQYERSTIAHNCISPDCEDSSEVWGGFRVGRRCRVEVLDEKELGIVALHDGFDKPCKRRFGLSDTGFIVEDWYNGNAVSYIHLAEGANPARIEIDGANDIIIKECQYSTEYNKFHNGKVVEIHFNGYLKYTIR